MPRPPKEKELPFVRCAGVGCTDDGEQVTFALDLPNGDQFGFTGDYMATTELAIELMKILAKVEGLRKATQPPAKLNEQYFFAVKPVSCWIEKLTDPSGNVLHLEMENGFPLALFLDDQRLAGLLEQLAKASPTKAN